MSLSSISPLSLLLILAIILLLFGSQRVVSLGRDLGVAFKQFREGMSETENEKRDDESR